MWPALKPSQREAIVGSIDPQSATTVQTTAWIDGALFNNYEALILIGAITATGVVNATIQQATSAAGAGAKALTSPLALTAVTQAAAGSSTQHRINFRGDLLDVSNGYRYFQLSITPSVAAALIAGVVQGVDPSYAPADGIAAATQVQIVG